MTIDEILLLKKIVSIQSSIIEGDGIKSILSEETSFFKGESGADIIVVCLENEDTVDVELILEDRQQFFALLRKYKLLPKHMELNKFIEQCNSHFKTSQERVRIESLHDIFDGHLSKKKTSLFEKEMDFNYALLYPIRNKTGKKIGLIIYFYSKSAQEHSKKLLQLTQVFEVLLRPFYDETRKLLREKCVQVDENMKYLTEKEKAITHHVLLGKSYNTIAQESNITVNTLKTHMKNIFNKYSVSSKIELHNKLMRSF